MEKRQANRLGTAGLEEQYSSRASYDTHRHRHLYATEEGGPVPMFPNPQLATDGNSGRHILPHVRRGVLLTIPGQLAAPTRRIDQDPRDNEKCWGKHCRATRKYSSSQQDGDSFLPPRGTGQHGLWNSLPAHIT